MSTEPAPLRCASASHSGLRRTNNEDRVHCDVDRGLFVVVDGVGGHNAGERAADIALEYIHAGVADGVGQPADRLRSAITRAHHEICRQAQLDRALSGMGCVLTAALIDNGIATVAHVGDTRLYKFRRGTVAKITHDHSPIGEQEESGALTEAEAMHHQMRNQVYRALGSTEQTTPDEEFVEIHQVPVERDSALLICSDGLSDLVPIAEITRIVEANADDPGTVAQQLVDAANTAGGKDNISLAFVSAPDFAAD